MVLKNDRHTSAQCLTRSAYILMTSQTITQGITWRQNCGTSMWQMISYYQIMNAFLHFQKKKLLEKSMY